jgi:outer membrane usher protein FimD/PapC
MTVVGTSPLPMPFFTYLGYIYTNNTSVNATIGYSSNAIDINANVHGNNNTQRWSTSLAGSFTYSAGNVLYITQTTGGNAIQSYPGSVGINDIISVFIK